MRSRAFRPIVATLSILLLTGVPVHAGPVAISEVIQVLSSYQNPPEIRLRTLTQTASTPISGATVNSSVQQSGANGAGTVDASARTNSLLAGVAVNSNDPQRGVEIIDQGDVEGTICDCGDILIPVGGFPKWPLLFLAAIPLFFIDFNDDTLVPTPTPPGPAPAPTQFSVPTPTPGPSPAPTQFSVPTPTPETPVPEPASLLLFGTGLAAVAAGLRRRYAKANSTTQDDAAKEGQ